MKAQPVQREYSALDELETVTLVDAWNNAIGSCGKISAHQTGKLHRAFSIFIANQDGEFLLQQRAQCKYHFAGRWSNTCCGHPRPGEQTLEAAQRRLWEELGFSVDLEEVDELQYRVVDQVTGLIEHEHLHVFLGHYSGEVSPNPDEVSAFRWMRPNRILRGLARYPDIFTPWFVLLAATLVRSDGIEPGVNARRKYRGKEATYGEWRQVGCLDNWHVFLT
jgi:isopentenyl-diphosphate delta-isomerase